VSRGRTPFQVDLANAAVDSKSIEALLQRVYVDGGFTDPALASSLFLAAAVFGRGSVLVARDPESSAITGMVIVVPPSSSARRLAAADEVEMQLLAVAPEYRKAGLGAALVEAALRFANGYEKMILWTQSTMKEAQRLYERHGFVRAPARDFDRAGRSFLVFERYL